MSGPEENAREEEPLKSGPEEEGVSTEHADGLGVSKLSGWRTAAFLLSLFLCLIIVFAFSFILPCPVRPQYQRTWSRVLPAAATYDFLAVADANRDKVQDVFFIYKSAEGTMNQTCNSKGLPAPCLFLLAVDGTDGVTLWEQAVADEFVWAVCGMGGVGTKEKKCLVAHADNLTAINIQTGVIVWQKPRSPVTNGRPPVILLPDLDGDGTNDIAVLSYNPRTLVPTELVFFSGKSGDVIGSKVDVDAGGVRYHLQLTLPSEAHYLLLHTDGGVYAMGVWRLADKAKSGLGSRLKKENSWEKKATDSGLIPIYESEVVLNVSMVRGGSGSSSPSLLLQTASTVMLLNTNTLRISWTKNTSQLINSPSFGHFNKDGVSDIVLEEYVDNTTKRVVILDGQTGGELWAGTLFSRTPSPRPASVLTIYSFSVFMLWGKTHTSNDTSGISEEWATYLLHPLHSSVLLERKNPAQNIISFKIALLERGRHACYFILTGADGLRTDGAGLVGAGSVVLTKRKIKDDVSESVVLGVERSEGQAVSTDVEKYVREAFNRLRFNEEVI
ncbi:protein FAM234A [Brachyhypopomus gauderio]|uniref:protein FAM234A n=1 Tax=Brachyhypopomus gauderio TaxID=698409 RepID=UPI004042635A